MNRDVRIVRILLVPQTILHDRSYSASECVCSCYINIKSNHKHKINLSYNGAMVEVFCWTVSVVCGKTAGVADSKISNPPVTFESNRNCPILIRIESLSFTGPYYYHYYHHHNYHYTTTTTIIRPSLTWRVKLVPIRARADPRANLGSQKT